ncbi:alpha/beta hydrolase [Thermodesulfobacteriota bacterium]
MDRIQHYEKHEILRLTTKDGYSLFALLITNKDDRREDFLRAPILLQIHGLLGHFLAHGTPRRLPHALFERGVDSLSLNTRLAHAGQFTSRGIFDDTINDIDAAVEFLEHEGFTNIFALGYSLGAAMLVNWVTHRQNERLKGIILEGLHYSFPRSQKKRFSKWGSNPSYSEIYGRAQQVLGDDPYNSREDETFVVYQSRGPDREPGSSEIFTYKSWWFMAGPEAHRSMARHHIHKIRIPVLFIRGEGDWLVENWEPEALAEIVSKAGNEAVRVRQIPDARHDCMENPEEMLAEITKLFREHSVDPYFREAEPD